MNLINSLSKSLILLGIKHCGKSTQAKSLATFFNTEFFDTDNLLFQATNKTARQVYNEYGKEKFLQEEKNICNQLNSKMKNSPLIISTGGGICENPDALNLLKENSLFIYLQIEEEIVINRILSKTKIKNDKETILDLSSLPSFIAKKNPHTINDVRTFFHTIYQERSKKYEKISDITINQKDLSVQEITNLIIQKLNY